MAIGLGLIFGIMLPINFFSPYKSLSITEFWQKWHITLGKFLKDYLYIPLGGNRISKIITLRNLFIVAFLSGIWHGAGFGFIIWGVLHGLAMVLHRVWRFLLESKRNSYFLQTRLYKIFCWFVTFNFLNISWVFFRAENVNGAINLLKGMFGIVWMESSTKISRMKQLADNTADRNEILIYLIVAFILCLGFKNSIQKLETFEPNYKNAILSGVFIYISLIILAITPYVEFIYFNF